MPCRRSRHHGDPRGEGAHAEIDAVGPAVGDAHAGIVDAERIGADLRHHGLDALPDRGRAGDDLDGAGVVDDDPHAVERAEPALLDEQRKPGADRFAAGAPPLQVGLQRSSNPTAARALSSRHA